MYSAGWIMTKIYTTNGNCVRVNRSVYFTAHKETGGLVVSQISIELRLLHADTFAHKHSFLVMYTKNKSEAQKRSH